MSGVYVDTPSADRGGGGGGYYDEILEVEAWMTDAL